MSDEETNLLRGGEGFYRFHERLGLLIDGQRKATPEEVEIASRESQAAVNELINQ